MSEITPVQNDIDDSTQIREEMANLVSLPFDQRKSLNIYYAYCLGRRARKLELSDYSDSRIEIDDFDVLEIPNTLEEIKEDVREHLRNPITNFNLHRVFCLGKKAWDLEQPEVF